ncbi:Toll/interleukin-1 receptor domain-containing protein [Tanacetum coccineum]
MISNLCTLWIGKHRLLANVTRFQRPPVNVKASAPFGGNAQPINKEVKDPLPRNNNSSGQTGRSSHFSNPGMAKQPKVHTGSYANVVSGAQGPLISPSPALVLEDSCLVERDLSRHVMGKVKDFSSIPNLYTILIDEGFSGAKLTYMGGTWVMIEFDKVDTKELLMNHSGIKSWFLDIKDAVDEFVSEDRIIWMDIEGVPLKAWSRETFIKIGKKWGETLDLEDNSVTSFGRKRICIKTKHATSILESFKIIVKGKVYMVRAKELFTWNPVFMTHKEKDCNSDGESVIEPLNNNDNEEEFDDEYASDVNEVPETKAGETRKSSPSLSHPPGFTPEILEDQNDKEAKDTLESLNAKVMGSSQEIPIVDHNDQVMPLINNTLNSIHQSPSKALENANLNTFLDDKEIETGLYLKPELESAIRASRASIIVLSKNYASSTWCLNELVDVRKQQNSFGDAMADHKQKMEAETNAEKKNEWAQKMEIWKKALTDVANLKGKEPKNMLETVFIEEIVTDIYHQLGVLLRSTLPQDPQLIGIDKSIRFLSSWLQDRSEHTGLADLTSLMWVWCGNGKTSLAKLSISYIVQEFNRSSFVENINVSVYVHDVSVYTSTIENALARKKVFIVLDDIDSLDQLDVLLGNKGFHPGSKIIITTKDASLTERCALFSAQSEDLKEGYKAVSYNIVNYCEGHPLALKVLGRLLHERDVAYWEDCIEGLKKEPDFDINNVLRMSFKSLPSKNDKELFKHIACFFVGKDRDFTETILRACNSNTRSGITHLVDKCLLHIDWNNVLSMHSLVQEMGRDEVRQESPDKPWKHSRLWCHEESFKVLKQKKDKANLLGLSLDMQMLENEKLRESSELKTAAFSNMDSLMILLLDYVQINGPYENFPEELRWLRMCGFPLKSIPSELPMENLVALDMSRSNIEFFDISCSSHQPTEKMQKLTGSCSKAKRLLGSLKILDLSFSEHLRGVSGFCELRSLESLFLRNCSSLIEICESIDHCYELVFIDLSNCKELRKLPRTLAKLKKVKKLLLNGCNMGELAVLEAVPRDFKSSAVYFPSSLVKLSLANNNLSNESFPMDLSCLSMLKELCLDYNPIVSMPDCVRTLPRLKMLYMQNCVMMGSIEHPPHTLSVLSFVIDNGVMPLIRKISFDPEMSPLSLSTILDELTSSSIEIEGVIKIQPIAGVDDTILCSLRWSNLEFIKKRRVGTYNLYRGPEGSQTQMYFEFGIFSTIYGGKVMPNWIRRRSKGQSISFTIPSSPKKLRGLNFCYVQTAKFPYWRPGIQARYYDYPYHQLIYLPHIKITNITKNVTWIYKHYIYKVNVGGKSLTFLSHWMFGENEMEDGDQVTIFIKQHWHFRDFNIRECGASLVYDDGKNENEEDPLGYYKSWNHIIGGDLSPFQLTTGEYNLQNKYFHWATSEPGPNQPHSYIAGDSLYKEKEPRFRAFSHKNSNTHSRAIEDVTK